MKRPELWRRGGDAAYLAMVALVTYGFKRIHRDATPEQLGWLLRPTVWCVERLSGLRFTLEPGAGYFNARARFLIAPVCAGLSFFLAVFLSGAVGFMGGQRGLRARAGLLLASLLAAYGVAVAANAIRITLALWLPPGPLLGLSGGQVHRLLGIAVYAATLLVVFAGVARWRSGLRLFVPLACYLFVAVGLPLLHGGFRDPAFHRHASIVVGSSLVLQLVAWLAARGVRWLQSRARASNLPGLGPVAPVC